MRFVRAMGCVDCSVVVVSARQSINEQPQKSGAVAHSAICSTTSSLSGFAGDTLPHKLSSGYGLVKLPSLYRSDDRINDGYEVFGLGEDDGRLALIQFHHTAAIADHEITRASTTTLQPSLLSHKLRQQSRLLKTGLRIVDLAYLVLSQGRINALPE
jgi:hypothetical protein